MIKLINFNVKQESLELLNEVSIEFKSKISIITGENGVGKTTLLQCLYGDKEYGGNVVLDDRELSIESKEELRKNSIKYISQNNNLFKDLTIIENIILFNPDADIKLIYGYAQKLNLSEKDLNTKVKKCSGGEKQKALFINAIVSDPQYLLIDELDNNVDKDSIIIMMSLLKELECQMLFVSHNMTSLLFEYFDEEDITIYKISNKTITNETRSQNKFETKNKVERSFDITKKNVKSVSKLLRNSIYRTTALIVISILIIMGVGVLLISNLTFGMSKIPLTLDSNQALIDIPSNGYTFPEYGDETWLEKTPFLFSEDNLDSLENLPYVESVVPIHSTRSDVNSVAYIDGDKSYRSEDEYDMSNVDFEKYGLDITSEEVPTLSLSFRSTLYPSDVEESLNGTDDLIAGSEPSDNTDEVLIDSIYASYLCSLQNCEQLDDLIGQEITLKLYELVHERNEITATMTISGIRDYKSTVGELTSSEIIQAYDTTSSIVTGNQPWLINDYDRLRELAKQGYTNLGMPFPDVSNEELGKYTTFFVTLTDEKYQEDLFNAVKDYDKYIYLISDYSSEHTNYYQYIASRVNKIILTFLIIFILLLLQMYLLSKKLIDKLIDMRDKLSFYGYEKRLINKVINKNVNKLCGLLIFFVVVLNGGVIFVLSMQYEPATNQLIIPLCILILIVLYSLLIKQKVKKV